MVQAILAYILIFVTIFSCSVSVSFTVLKSGVKPPESSKFRILQQKRIVNGLLKNYTNITSTQNSLKRELLYKKNDLKNQLVITDSLLNEIELNQSRLEASNKLLNKNNKILSDVLK